LINSLKISIVYNNYIALVFKLLLLSVAPFNASHFFAALLPLKAAIEFFVKYQGKFISLKESLVVNVVGFRFSVSEVKLRPKNGIHAQSEHILYHSRNQPLKHGRRKLKTWVRIDLDEVGLELVIDDEI